MRYILATFFALVLGVSGLVGVQAAQAAGLTEAQISAVVGLVSSFGADAATIKNVEASLRGQPADNRSYQRNDDDKRDNRGMPLMRACLELKRNLQQGATDGKTEGEVSKLQQFLKDEGEFKEAKVTGYFGPATARALMQWQKKQGMNSVTANSGVGPMTREKLKAACMGMMQKKMPADTSVTPVTPVPTPVPVSTTTSTTTAQ